VNNCPGRGTFYASANAYITANNCTANTLYSQNLSYLTMTNFVTNYAWAVTANSVLNISDGVVNLFLNATENGVIR
jgi:hypothetical protein